MIRDGDEIVAGAHYCVTYRGNVLAHFVSGEARRAISGAKVNTGSKVLARTFEGLAQEVGPWKQVWPAQ